MGKTSKLLYLQLYTCHSFIAFAITTSLHNADPSTWPPGRSVRLHLPHSGSGWQRYCGSFRRQLEQNQLCNLRVRLRHDCYPLGHRRLLQGRSCDRNCSSHPWCDRHSPHRYCRYCFGRRSWCPQLRKQIVPRSNALTNGSNNPSKRCHELQASTAFYWFAFAAFLGSAILGFMSGGSSFSRPRGGIRKGGPTMSQV